MAISAKPMGFDLNEVENFSFLGLHENISIYIDATTQLPIQVSGIIPTIGQADLKLNKVLLKH